MIHKKSSLIISVYLVILFVYKKLSYRYQALDLFSSGKGKIWRCHGSIRKPILFEDIGTADVFSAHGRLIRLMMIDKEDRISAVIEHHTH